MAKPNFERTCTLFYVEKNYKKPDSYNVYKFKKPGSVEQTNNRVTVHWRDRILGLYRPDIYYSAGCFVLVNDNKELHASTFYILKLRYVSMSDINAFTDFSCSAEFSILPSDPVIINAVVAHENSAKTQHVSYSKFSNPSAKMVEDFDQHVNAAMKSTLKKCNPALGPTIKFDEIKELWMRERQKMTRGNDFGFVKIAQQPSHHGFGMPRITKIYYNEPHTTVKWSDGSITVVGCAEGETFSKELGLAVAIAKKYYEDLGSSYPRAALKRAAENGIDQTAKTKARKKYKQDKKNSEKQE